VSFRFLVFALLAFSSCTRPLPQLVEERELFAEKDLLWLDERIGHPAVMKFTLNEAIEFAINHSLSLRVQEAELRVVGDRICREMILMLPTLEASALAAHRSNLASSISQSTNPQIPILPPSFGSLQTTNTSSVELAWNILNTGIQYFRVKQAKNATWAKEFIYQRAVQDLIRDVVSVYWLAAVMQESAKHVDEVTEISRDLTKKLRNKVDEGHISLSQATDLIGKIYYQLVQAKLQLRTYWGAMDQFKALLGIPPCTEVILQIPEQFIPAELPNPCDLHEMALNYRPELYQIDAEMAVHEDEVRAALLNLFPELTPFINYTADLNPFLVNNYWTTVGFRVLYNLLSIPLSLNSQQTAQDQVCVSKSQRLFFSLTILAQIHIAHAQYQDAFSRYKDAQIYYEAKKNSFDLALARKKLGAIGDLEYVFPLSDLLFAETQMNLFYVEMMGSLEQLSNSIGIPRYFTEKYGTALDQPEEEQEETEECI